MSTIRDYDPLKVGVSKKVLLEIGSILKEYQKDIVLVGGWTPYFLLEKYKPENLEFNHCGSLDIDLAINFISLPKADEVYRTVSEIIKRNGYQERVKDGAIIPYCFERDVEGNVIRIDFLTQFYGGTGKSHRTQPAQDILARKAKGCEIAFKCNEPFLIEGMLPNGAKHKTEILVAGVPAILTMKGYAFSNDISRTKDGYDIFSLLKYYKNGISSIKDEVGVFLSNKLVLTALEKIKDLFNELESVGATAVADFIVENKNSPDWEFQRRDAFETVQSFLKVIK
jgi:hypothetical protein